jgi:hypothetical protein
MPKDEKLYGPGAEKRNPYFPSESHYDGGRKNTDSPHGSAFNTEIHATNSMDEALKGKHGIKGKLVGDANEMRGHAKKGK